MNKNKRILYTSFDGLPNTKEGGPNNIIYKILLSLDRNKYSPSFLSYRNYIDNPPVAEINEVRPGLKKRLTNYFYYNAPVYKKITSNSLYLKHHFELKDKFFDKYSSDDKYDIIHSHDSLSHYYFANNRKALKILTIHGNGSIESDWADAAKKNEFIGSIMPDLKQREIEAYNSADIVTFPGQFAKELFLEDYKGMIASKKDIRIVNNGIDVHEIDEIKPQKEILKKYGFNDKNDIVLLNVAGHVRQKNINVILKVIQNLVGMKYNPMLINAGIGQLTDEIKSDIKKYKLEKNVKLIGNISHEEIICLMKSADAMIMLSDRVIFDLVMLEASACRIPVITNREGGNREILNGYPKLIEVNNADARAIAVSIIENIYDKTKTKTKRTDFLFTIENMIKGYEELYSAGKR